VAKRRRRNDARGAKGPRRPTGWWLTLLGLAAVLLAAWWVTRSSIFEASSISIKGNRHLSRAELLDLAGVDSDTNLVWFRPGAVEDRIERSPWVLSAEVSRALPSTLRISVRERTAIAVVTGDRRLLVAGDRTILGVAKSSVDLPEIEAPADALVVGDLLPGPNPGLQVLAAMPSLLRIEVDRVSIDRDGLLVVTLMGDIQAIYGDASQAEAKAGAVQALLRYAARHEIEAHRLDVRAPGHPALRPDGGETGAA
jgi:cell division protein FtsQ